MLSSMIQLVPGGHILMRSLQLPLRRQWGQIDQSQLVEWSPVIQDDLSWWCDCDRLVLGVFSGAGVPSARVMVRRLGRGLGGSLGRAVR